MRLQKKYLAIAISALFVSSTISISSAAHAQGYEVVDLGSVPGALSATVNDMNEQGHFVGLGYNVVDIPLRVDLLNPDDFESIDDLNNLSAAEYITVRNSLFGRGSSLNNPSVQKLTQFSGLWYNGAMTTLNNSLDVIEPVTGLLTRSNDLILHGINNSNQAVGEFRAPFLQVNGVDENDAAAIFFERDRMPQALWTNGVEHVELTGESGVTYSGISRAYAINDNNQVVGFAAIEDTPRVVSAYENCLNPESTSAHLPLGVCMYTVWASAEYEAATRSPLYQEAAYMWELDATGNVLAQRSLGMAPTVLDDNEGKEDKEKIEGTVRSEALDVNDAGVAVGFTTFSGPFVLNYATVYNEGKAEWVIPKTTQGYAQSKATHINNNGYIAGFTLQVNLQYPRERTFIAHTDGREVEFPGGFFADSSWRPRGINNLNQVVGRAERDRTQVQQRRTVAFMYDIDKGTIVDLNSLMGCHSGYDLFDAVSINDNGDIIALANMEEVRVIDGREYTGLSVKPVLLRASNAVESCGDPSDKQERKGSAVSPIQLAITFVLGGMFYITRRRRKAQK